MKDEEVARERGELETFKRGLERQLREAENEMDTQRRELTAGLTCLIQSLNLVRCIKL